MIRKHFLSYLLHIIQSVRLADDWQNLSRGDVLLVRSDLHCGYRFQGKAYAHLVDSIGDLCARHGLVTCSVAASYSKLTGNRAYNSPISYNRQSLFIALLKRAARLFKGHADGENLANEYRARLWCQILDKVKPRCVIGIQPDVGLCRAGKIKNVPVYDLQHGVIAEGHGTYSEKYRVNTPPEDLPDGFLCWDEPSAETLRKWASPKGIKVLVIGNIWFLRFLFRTHSDPLVEEAIKAGRIFYNNRPAIMVSLQWGLTKYYKYDGFNGVMVDALEKTILETASSYNWLLRLHPLQLRGSEKEKAQAYLTRTFGHLTSVEWRLTSELPLPVVLQQVDLHITDMSTIVVEAGWMGIPSALLSTHFCAGGVLERYYAHERNIGIATILPQYVNVIKRWIVNSLAQGKVRSTLTDTRDTLQKFIQSIATQSAIDIDDRKDKRGKISG